MRHVDAAPRQPVQVVPPAYDSPPAYEWTERPRSQLTGTPEWLATSTTRPVRHSPGWTKNPRPLSKAPHSPASRFRSLEAAHVGEGPPTFLKLAHSPIPTTSEPAKYDNRPRELNGNLLQIDPSYATVPRSFGQSRDTVAAYNQTGQLLTSSRSQGNDIVSQSQYLTRSPKQPPSATFERRGTRQASFMAAIASGSKLKIARQVAEENKAPPHHNQQPRVWRKDSLRAALEEKEIESKKFAEDEPDGAVEQHHLDVDSVEGGGQIVRVVLRSPQARSRRHRRFAAASGQAQLSPRSLLETKRTGMPTNGEAHWVPASPMRRPRPKSYVLATSSSFPLADHDIENKGVSSFPSVESIERRPHPGAPHQPATERITRFIQRFSQNDPQKTSTTTKGHATLKRSRTAGPPAERNALLKPTPVQAASVQRQGLLQHQEHPIGVASRRVRPSQWEQRWAVLAGKSLYLCKQLSSYVCDVTRGQVYSVPADSVEIELSSAIIDIAYDALKREGQKHVVRVVTQQHREHLLQTQSEEDMLSWIAMLQKAATLCISASPDPASTTTVASDQTLASRSSSLEVESQGGHVASGTSGSLTDNSFATQQLIMQRYKAKTSQISSPLTKRVSDALEPSTAGPSFPVDGKAASHEVGTTPKNARKNWRGKTKPAKGQAAATGPNGLPDKGKPNSALGQKLVDCKTSGPEDAVPMLVRHCLRVVEENGMESVGIYRIPGNTAAVNALKDTLNQGDEAIDWSDPRWKDVNVVSSLLKMFLRKLPEPLLTDKLYPYFIDANRITNHTQRLHKIRNLLRKLHPVHYHTLKHLMAHLLLITTKSDINRMEARNLGLMFGPSIVRPSDDNMSTMVTHMGDQCQIIESFIIYYDWIFNDKGDSEDPVPAMIHTEPLVAPGTQGLELCPAGVSSSSFNDMHNMIRRVNEAEAADMMRESRTGKIINIINLRRNSQRKKDKAKSKPENTSSQASFTRSRKEEANSNSSKSGETSSGFQERNIDAAIESRQKMTPATSTVDHSPSLESSLGSLPDSSRTLPEGDFSDQDPEAERRNRKRVQEDMSSARRMFILGNVEPSEKLPDAALDALVSHTQHLHVAESPKLEVLSEATREKIRMFQSGNHIHASNKMTESILRFNKPRDGHHFIENQKQSPLREDALSFSSSLSTNSSIPYSMPMTVSIQPGAASSDYASISPISPYNKQEVSPQRPKDLLVNAESKCEQKIRMRNKGSKDPRRRHTLTDVDLVAHTGTIGRLARWFGFRKSSPDVRECPAAHRRMFPNSCVPPNGVTDEETGAAGPSLPSIVRTSPTELTPASGDEQL